MIGGIAWPGSTLNGAEPGCQGDQAASLYRCFIGSRKPCHAMPGLQDEAWRRFDPLPSLRAQLGQSQKVGPIS